MADRKNKATHERLYELNKERQEKLRQKQIEEREKYLSQSRPDQTMSIQRRENLETTLYEDAHRRKKDLEKLKEELDKTRLAPKEKAFHNDNSDKYVMKRLERELQQL